MKSRLLLALLFAIYVSGCATIMNGTTQSISVSSDPEGANAKSDNGEICSTPCSLVLPRNNSHLITIEKEGYDPEKARITSGLSGWFWGNLLFWGLLVAVVDLISGSGFALSPGNVSVSLQKKIKKSPSARSENYSRRHSSMNSDKTELISMLDDSDHMVSGRAAYALAKSGNMRGLTHLHRLLKNDKAQIRGKSAMALGEIKDARSVRPLIGLLQDSDDRVRASAVRALGTIGDNSAKESVQSALKNDQSPIVRTEAKKALQQFSQDKDFFSQGMNMDMLNSKTR